MKKWITYMWMAAGIILLYMGVLGMESPSAEATETEDVTITILLADKKQGKTLANTKVSLYQLAIFTDSKERKIQAAAGCEDLVSGMDLTSTDTVCTYANMVTAKTYIKEKNLAVVAEATTDAEGRAAFGTREAGIYLAVFGENDVYDVDAFLVEAPYYENGTCYMDVVASPKISPKPEDTTEETTEDTTEVTTEPGPDEPPLPQTGQLRWPIPVLLILGITLIVTGYAFCCYGSSEKKEQKS